MIAFLRTSHCLRRNRSVLIRQAVQRHSHNPLSSRTRCISFYSTQVTAEGAKRPSEFRRVPRVRAFGFAELGVIPSLVKALKAAFSDINKPTLSQAEFIPAILNNKDVLLQDETGTGKSLGAILALLNKRRPPQPRESKRARETPCIASLVVVPHRDLGYQMLHWILSILKHSGPKSPSLDVLAQLVVRGGGPSAAEQAARLRETPPHILIGTPQALLDVYETDSDALQLDALSTVYVDEVDYLLDVPPPYTRPRFVAKAWRNFKKHPSTARKFLEILLPMRKYGAKPLGEEASDLNDDEVASDGQDAKQAQGVRPLQVVMSSATVHANLTEHLIGAHWLDEGFQLITGKQLAKLNAHMIDESASEIAGAEVIHHALVVSANGDMENADLKKDRGRRDEDEDTHTNCREKPGRARTSSVHGPTSSQMLEAVATIFALDVPQLALLVLPHNISVQTAISELRDLGVDARALDMRSGDGASASEAPPSSGAEPALLVATHSTTRGIDLPQLSHVICVGVPDVASADTFKHIAGRVDRFGRGGKMITLITEAEYEYRDGMVRLAKNPAGMLGSFYTKLGIAPVPFDLSALASRLSGESA